MDYWDYLAHGAGGERKNHKYVARVPLGTRNGRVRFKYFYSSAEYAAYLRRSNKRRALNQKIGEQKKEMDRQRQARRNARRIGEKHSMDRKRWARDAARRIGEQHSMDRKRWDTEARAEQVKKDAEAYRRKRSKQNVTRQKVAMDAKRYEQHSMDRKRWDTEARAEQVKKDAEAYRRKRSKQNVTRQKVAMDAKRYRKQRQAQRWAEIQERKKEMDRKRHKSSVANSRDSGAEKGDGS